MAKKNAIQEQVREMLAAGIIEASSSPLFLAHHDRVKEGWDLAILY